MTLNLVEGDFTKLEDALRAQVQLMQERIDKLERQVHVVTHERNEWRTKYALIHHGLAVE